VSVDGHNIVKQWPGLIIFQNPGNKFQILFKQRSVKKVIFLTAVTGTEVTVTRPAVLCGKIYLAKPYALVCGQGIKEIRLVGIGHDSAVTGLFQQTWQAVNRCAGKDVEFNAGEFFQCRYAAQYLEFRLCRCPAKYRGDRQALAVAKQPPDTDAVGSLA